MSFLTNIQLGSATPPGAGFTANRYINAGTFSLTFTGTGITGIETSGTGIKITDGRAQNDKGANIVAANDLTLGVDGNTFTVTGNNQINAITSANWQNGSWVILETTGTPLFKHNTAGGAGTLPLKLAGSVDFQAAVDDAILFYNNGSFWHELARKQAAAGGLTADNGLTENVANNVQLGGTLIKDTTIATSTFQLGITNSSTTEPPLFATNSSTGQAFIASNTSTGNHAIEGTNNSSGPGVRGLSLSGGVGMTALCIHSSTNTVRNALHVYRQSSGTPANGIGVSVAFGVQASDGNVYHASEIKSNYLNATASTKTSQLFVSIITDNDTHDIFYLGGAQSYLLSRDAATNQTDYRYSVTGTYKALTESSATAFVRISVPSGTATGGEILITVEANDATDVQSRTLRFIWSAVNKAGTITANVQTPEESVAVSAGTLTVTIDTNDAGSGNLDFRANAVSSLTQTVLRCSYQVLKNIGTGAITPQ